MHQNIPIFDINIFKLIVDNGCDVNHKNIFNMTPLCYAINILRYNVCEYLLQNGANVNLRCGSFTPLHLVVVNIPEENDKLYKLCVLLVENGADIFATDTAVGAGRPSNWCVNRYLKQHTEYFKIYSYLKDKEYEREHLNQLFKRARSEEEKDEDVIDSP